MIKSFRDHIFESKIKFTNWVKPDKKDLALEYKIEYSIKPLKNLTGNAFPTLESFLSAVNKAKVLKVTPAIDSRIQYRSRTRDKKSLISLIKNYASYPQYRNEKTIDAIYDGYRDNKPMKMPLVLKLQDGTMRVMGGNTRADIGMQLLGYYMAILVEVPEATE